jgi:hypothetical protein
LLASLPNASRGLGNVYQACGQALDTFGDTLTSIQARAAALLEQAMQASAEYCDAAAAVCDLCPGTTMTGINEPGPVWRGLTAAWAEEAGMAYAEEDPALPEIAAGYGGTAQAAEAERQDIIGTFQSVVADYQAAVDQCVSAIQAAAPDMPSQFITKMA